ncbi:MAG: response regulator transcription factor [Planctomycetes bacterium]|nr:response regulator transcription factor [Planctomycetota bacterium]
MIGASIWSSVASRFSVPVPNLERTFIDSSRRALGYRPSRFPTLPASRSAPVKQKILIIEDEPDILEVMQYNLQRDGYKVIACRNGEQGLSRIRTDAPNLVVLDLMLPGMDGVEVCRQVKSDAVTRGIPIIMVTAKSEESDVVLGLGLGADDYITKPFSPRELLARIDVVLRRGPLRDEVGAKDRVVRGSLQVDLIRHEARIGDRLLTLTPTEMRLLHFLASHPGRVFPRGHLLSRVIGEDAVVTDRNIDVHVRALRQKLGEQQTLIETVRGVGYRFAESAQ